MNKNQRRLQFFLQNWQRNGTLFQKQCFYFFKKNLPLWKNAIIDFFHFILIFRKKFTEDRVFNQSASLTFVTLLGFIPFIIFTVFFLPELPFLKLESQFTEIIKSIFVPDSADQIYEHIAQLAQRKISFNLFSFLILLFTSYSLFKIINDTFDNILNAHETKKRSFFQDIVKFFGMTIFGSLLILILLSASSLPIISKFFRAPFLQSFFLYVTPFILLFIVFTIGFFYIPTVKVSRKSILIGAAVSSSVWILFKSVFNWYIFNLTNTKLIFGYLASIPIFLFWIYANWIIILSGVIIVSILEKRHVKREISKKELRTIRITLEKVVTEEDIEKIERLKTDEEILLKSLRLLTNSTLSQKINKPTEV